MFRKFKELIYNIPVSRNLTLEDFNIILQRGFLVKKNFTVQDFLILTAKLVIYVAFIFFVSLGIISMIYIFIVPFKNFAMIGVVLIGLYFIFKGIVWYLYDYLRSGITFYNIRGTIDFGEISFLGLKSNPNKGMLLLEDVFKKIISPTNTGFKNYTFVAILIFVIFYLLFLWGLYIGLGFLTWIFLLFLSRVIFQSFHPLYAFGNLGEKIQSFTPLIKEKSKQIQANFENDMNFQALSEGFDSLSSTFSQIVTLVIKLEQIEKKANKGNLFDSTKYINSLRDDIREPLKQLKSFLEKQKEQLEKSQEVLQKIIIQQDSSIKPEGQSSGGQKVRVRVGGADSHPSHVSHRLRRMLAFGGVTSYGRTSFHGEGQEQDPETSSGGQSSRGQEQALLSSKRSEPLLVELTENIGKLDEMIGKMG